MRLRTVQLLFLIWCLTFPISSQAQAYLPNQLRIKISSASFDVSQLKVKILREIPQLEEVDIRPVFPNQVFNQSKLPERKNELYLYHNLYFKGNIDVEELIPLLTANGEISYSQPHYVPILAGVPNDSLIGTALKYHHLMGLYQAWEINQGDTSVVVGIVDSGTDLDHVDLRGNLSVNEVELLNGVDDDGDGYIDNRFGWDVAENDNDPQVLKSSHGVHMCGLVGAVPNNKIGVAGIGYSCKFLPVKIADDNTGALVAAYEGVKYAADAGVDIINCSWGSYSIGKFEREVIDYAVNTKNCLLIGAAGNDNENNIFYPAALEGVLAVASTDTNDRKAFNSNYNELIDISAPGVSIVSTWDKNLYQSNTGTSVASAIVAGGAALVKSQFPTFTNQQVVELLIKSSDYIDLNNREYAQLLGRGRINLINALTNNFTPEFQDINFNLYPNPVSGQQFRLKFYWLLNTNSHVKIVIFNSRGDLIWEAIDGNFNKGIHEKVMDVSSLSKGLYLVRFTSDSQKILKKVIIE